MCPARKSGVLRIGTFPTCALSDISRIDAILTRTSLHSSSNAALTRLESNSGSAIARISSGIHKQLQRVSRSLVIRKRLVCVIVHPVVLPIRVCKASPGATELAFCRNIQPHKFYHRLPCLANDDILAEHRSLDPARKLRFCFVSVHVQPQATLDQNSVMKCSFNANSSQP